MSVYSAYESDLHHYEERPAAPPIIAPHDNDRAAVLKLERPAEGRHDDTILDDIAEMPPLAGMFLLFGAYVAPAFLTYGTLGSAVAVFTGGVRGVLIGMAAGVSGSLAGEIATENRAPATRAVFKTLAATFAAAVVGLAVHAGHAARYERFHAFPADAVESCLYPKKPVVSCVEAVTGYKFSAPSR